MWPSLLVAVALSTLVTQIAVFVTSIYLHRSLTHRALVLHPAVAWICRLCLWIMTAICPRAWVAVHRKHHAFIDEDGDPHSPQLKGYWRIQLGNAFYYLREVHRDKTLVPTYAKDIKVDRWDRLLFDHLLLGPVVGFGILYGLLGLKGALLATVLHTIMYAFVLTPAVNALCHLVGYRNFENTATNIPWLAWFTGGEGYHNNHHGVPRSPKLSCQPGEFDVGWSVISVLARLNLAQPYKTIEQVRERR